MKPDLSVFGKAIANGFPLSAVVGIEKVMSITTPKTGRVSFAGTYNGSQPSLAASKACLEQLKDGAVQKKLGNDSQTLVHRFEESANRTVWRLAFRASVVNSRFTSLPNL